MEVKEMFENLDFVEVARNYNGLWYQNMKNYDFVYFDLEEKKYIHFIAAWCNFEQADFCSIELHKTIHQQLIELGWL